MINQGSAFNPYDFTNPVSDISLLVGREKEMEEIRYYLDNAKNAPRPTNIAILGQRASGKTSILNIAEDEAKKRGFCTVRIDLDEGNVTSELAFFFKLFDSILEDACASGAFEGTHGKTYDTYLDAISAYSVPEDKTFSPFIFPIQFAKAMSSGNPNVYISERNFVKDLIKIHDELKRPIVVLIDEGNVLVHSRVLLQKLRNTFMNIPGYMLIMTGTPDLFPLLDEVFSPIARQFKKIDVGDFSKLDDTRNCIRKPLEKVGINFEEMFDFETYRDVSDIHNLSGGRPYEIQFICHVLFRRVQSKRAESMKLDFGVLEEARRELEKWQDVTSRPILTAVRHLKKQQLSALSLLCSCNSIANFDQLWSFEYIFRGETFWNKNILCEVLENFISKGIVKIENDLISFAGDDFDRIYTKYFAREQGISITFSPFPLEIRWQTELNAFIELDQRIEDRLTVLFDPVFFLNMKDGDIADLIQKFIFQNTETDYFVDYAPLPELIYALMIEYRHQKIVPLFTVNPNLPWLNSQLIYRSTKPTDIEALQEGIDWIQSMGNRINELGGNLVIEKKYVPVIPVEDMVTQVLHTANESARFSIAEFHLGKMYEEYENEIDHEAALFHANLSYQYHSEPDGIGNSNNLGYVFLGMSDFAKAEPLFKRAINLSKSNKQEADNNLAFPGLAIYNLGVLHTEQGLLETALADFQLCIDHIRDLSSEERSMSCLWIPVINHEALVFEEHKSPDLLEAAETAKAIIEHILTFEDSND